MITPDDPFRSAPRISRDRFAQVVRQRAAPGVVAERDPVAYWDAIVAYGIDPLLILAMFQHESEMGKKGVAVTTHSWGNTRTPNFGATPIGTAPGRTGTFPIWRDWLDGVKSTAARLAAPNYVYASRTSIRDIFDWPPAPDVVWAPAGDLNNPNGYLRAVIDFMNAHADGGEEPPMAAQIPGFIWQPADAQHYTPGRTMPIRGGAQHYSAGTNSLAWLTTTSGVTSGDPVSATFLVKHNPTLEDRGWQLVRIEDTAWTTASANAYTVSIEYEHDGRQPIPDRAYTVLAQTWIDIAAYVASRRLGSIPLDRTGIRGHKEWVNNPRLVCPDGIDVDRIVAEIRARTAAPPSQPPAPVGPPPMPATRPDPWGTAFWIPEVFVADIRRHDWMVTGFAVSEAFAEGEQLVQYFERARLEFNRDGRVTRGLVGIEALVARYPERRRG